MVDGSLKLAAASVSGQSTFATSDRVRVEIFKTTHRMP